MICLGIGSGFIFQVLELGVKGIVIFIINISLPVIVLFLLFHMRALGAGDIKLFSVIGSIWSIELLVRCIVFSFIVGAIMALCRLIMNKNLISRLIYFCSYMIDAFRARKIKVYNWQSDGKENRIHFSISILLGFLCTMVMEVVY